ncbi:hypothetical protein, partial [Bacillus altitudinis]
ALSESCLLATYELQDFKHKTNEPDRFIEFVYATTDHDAAEIQA